MYLDPNSSYTIESDVLTDKSVFPLRENHLWNRPEDISILISSALVLNKVGTYDVHIPGNIQEHPHAWSFVILIVKKVMDQLPLSSEDMISVVRSMISEQSLIMLDKKFPWAVDSAVNGWLLTKNLNWVPLRTEELLKP